MSITTERVHADHTVTKRLGHWTDSGHVEVRARSGAVVLDLRSPNLPDEIEIHLQLRRAMVKLLVPEDATVDHWDLSLPAKGRVKDAHGATAPGGATPRRIRLTGLAEDSEIRIHRGGVAALSAMCSREYLRDLRAAHKAGRYPSVDDPARESG